MQTCKLLITNHEADISIKVGCKTIIGQKSVKLLGIKLDKKLDFNEHITNVCKKNFKVACSSEGFKFYE